jgi:superfamily II DNA or RNA helicase
VPSVLQAADRRLTEVRRHVPDAGGLVIASDQDSARAYARLLGSICGEKPTVVLSDEKSASRRIAKFSDGDGRWMVAVRMVSEGVDVPRLAVGVYATNTATPLFFAQAVGRFVRARRRGETATVFLPSVTSLLDHAAAMEVERDHVLGRPVRSDDDILAAEEALAMQADAEAGPVGEEQPGFAALSSEASFDHVLYDGAAFGHEGGVAVGSDEEMDFLGIPGLLEPDQVRDLLRHRQSERLREQRRAGRGSRHEPAAHERLAGLRKELNGLVAAWHHRSGAPHGVIHAELQRACGGPPTAVASAAELRERIDKIREWAARRRTP